MVSTQAPVEVVTCDVVIYPSELPVVLSCRMAPVNFRCPLAAQCWASTDMLSWVPAEGPEGNEESFHPGEPAWGPAHSSRSEAPIHLWL